MTIRRSNEDLEACREMHANFDYMQKGDVLTWDSPSIGVDSRVLYRRAMDKGWTISIKSTPPVPSTYQAGVRGRLVVTRLS